MMDRKKARKVLKINGNVTDHDMQKMLAELVLAKRRADLKERQQKAIKKANRIRLARINKERNIKLQKERAERLLKNQKRQEENKKKREALKLKREKDKKSYEFAKQAYDAIVQLLKEKQHKPFKLNRVWYYSQSWSSKRTVYDHRLRDARGFLSVLQNRIKNIDIYKKNLISLHEEIKKQLLEYSQNIE